MKKPEQNQVDLESRRTFLKTMAAAGGAAATLGAAGGAVAAPAEEIGQDASSDKLGYQETRHIQDYYAKADF